MNRTLNQVISQQAKLETSLGADLILTQKESAADIIAGFKKEIDRVVAGLEELRRAQLAQAA